MENLNTIPKTGNYGSGVDLHNDNYSKIGLKLETLENMSFNEKGYFESLSALQLKYPTPQSGWQAYVKDAGSSTGYYVANVNSSGNWVVTSAEAPAVAANLNDYTLNGGSTKTTQEIEDEIVQLAGTLKKQVVKRDGEDLYIGSKYDADYDIIIHFKMCMFNNLMTFFRVGLAPNKASKPLMNPDRPVTVILNQTDSDNIGPININGTLWAGGNHSYGNDGVTKTAETISFEFIVDGAAIADGEVVSADVVKVIVKNNIFNPTIPPVSGILNQVLCVEDVHYIVDCGNIEVSLGHNYLNTENVILTQYYGMQSMFSGETDIMTPRGAYKDFTPVSTTMNFSESNYPDFDRFIEKKGNYYQSSYLIPVDNGVHDLLVDQTNIFLRSGTKTYHRIANAVNLHDGFQLSWSGLYSWFSPILNNSDLLVYSVRYQGNDILFIDTKRAFNGYVPVEEYMLKSLEVINNDSGLQVGRQITNKGLLIQSNAAATAILKVGIGQDLSTYALKNDLTESVEPLQEWQSRADRFRLNKGREYPVVGYPFVEEQQTKVNNLKNILLDAELYPDGNLYSYYPGGFYKDHVTFGNGFILMRKHKTTGAIGGLYLTSLAGGSTNVDSETISAFVKWADGGVQTTTINITNPNFGIKTLTITVDTDAFTGYVPIGFQDNENWGGSSFDPICYKRIVPSAAPIRQISTYDTFKAAMNELRTGIVKVGPIMAESKVGTVINPGDVADYKPSAVYNQYRTLNKNSDAAPKSVSQIMEVRMESGIKANIKSFGKRYTYFGDGSTIYRTQDELIHNIVSHTNTNYEKITLPATMPDGVFATVNSIQNVYELDNGELLIECRNGNVETEGDPYTGRRIQLYVTEGMKGVIPTIGENNIPEYDITGIVSKVHEYKAYTATRGKQGTVVSIAGSRIALSPYHTGLVGLVHYSSDYGKTWKVIFNMGVMGEEFSVPYKGSEGAWPLPENLNPQMPANMWTEGGNANIHVHGVCIDPFYDNRIWVATGDAGNNFQGRTAIWYTDDEGINWTRVQSRGIGVYDAPSGVQPMGFIVTKDYVLMSSDSSVDGLYRHSRTEKQNVPIFEAAYWYRDEFYNNLRVLGGGGVVTREGYVYYLFHPNTPSFYDRGVVVFTPDGVAFEEVYKDEISDGTSNSDRLIGWGSWLGQDRFGNVFIVNNESTLVKLF